MNKLVNGHNNKIEAECSSVEITTVEHGTVILWVDGSDRIVVMAKEHQLAIRPRGGNMVYLVEDQNA
jgi:hypothetical protein